MGLLPHCYSSPELPGSSELFHNTSKNAIVSCSGRSSAGHRQHNPPAPICAQELFWLCSAHSHPWEPFGGFPAEIPLLHREFLFTFGDTVLNWILIRSVFAGLIFKPILLLNQKVRPDQTQCLAKLAFVTATPSPLASKLSASSVKLDWQLCGSQSKDASPALHLHACWCQPQQHSSVCTPGKGCLQHLRVFTDGWTSVTELHRPTNGQQNLWF